jgi:hypothetical protein
MDFPGDGNLAGNQPDMKRITLAILMACPCFAFSQYTYDKLTINYQPTDAELRSITYANLRLYPIRAKESFTKEFQTIGKYVPLEEALEKKKVKITEKANGGEVNNLTVENVSADTIIIIPGEIVKGGKQDRIINKDILLLPHSGKVNLPVYCVESGRWSAGSPSSPDAFASHYHVGSMELRKVVEKDMDQSKVWAKVEEINTKNKTTTNTKTYTALDSSRDYKRKLEEYLNWFSGKFGGQRDVIGVVVVTGDKVLGCDMFATNELFSQHYANLLHSYATEAVVNGRPVNIQPGKVKEYMDGLLTSEQRQAATLKQKGNSFVVKSKKLRVTSFD